MIDVPLVPSCRLMLLFLLLLTGFRDVHAQAKAELFTTVDGKRFNHQQRDSIEQLGNFIGVKEKHWRGDTLVYSIFYYDKSFLLSPFQKQYIGQPFPDFNLLSMEEEWINATQLKGKAAFIYVCLKGEPVDEEVLVQMNDLQEKYGDRIHFIALFEEEAAEVATRMKQFRLRFKLLPAKSVVKNLHLKEDTWFISDHHGIVRHAEQGIPVDMKVKPDGAFRSADDPFKILVYDWYGERLEKLLSAK